MIDKTVSERCKQCSNDLLEIPEKPNTNLVFVLHSDSVKIFSSTLTNLIGNASPSVQLDTAQAFAHHELRFLLCLTLSQERAYFIFRTISQIAKQCSCPSALRASLLRQRALVCSHSRWKGARNLLLRAKRLNSYDKHSEHFDEIFCALEREDQWRLIDIYDSLSNMDISDKDDAAAYIETLVAISLGFIALHCYSTNTSLTGENTPLLETSHNLTVEQIIDNGKNAISKIFSAKHPLFQLCETTKSLDRSSIRKHKCAITKFQQLWVYTNQKAVNTFFRNYRSEELWFDNLYARIDFDDGLDDSDTPE